MEIKGQKCGAVFTDRNGTYHCELPEQHVDRFIKKHRDGGVQWSDQGKARIKAEIAAEKAAKKKGGIDCGTF